MLGSATEDSTVWMVETRERVDKPRKFSFFQKDPPITYPAHGASSAAQNLTANFQLPFRHALVVMLFRPPPCISLLISGVSCRPFLKLASIPIRGILRAIPPFPRQCSERHEWR